MSNPSFIMQKINEKLDELESHVRTIIKLQKIEDSTPDPPNFEQIVSDWIQTENCKGLEQIDNLANSSELEPVEQYFCYVAKKVFQELGTTMPENPIAEYPFKTAQGRFMRFRLESIEAYAEELLSWSLPAIQTEKFQALNRLLEISKLILEEFPEANWQRDDKGGNISSSLLNRHYYVVCAYMPFMHVPKIVIKPYSERLLSYLFKPTIFRIKMKFLNFLKRCRKLNAFLEK